MQPTAFKKDEVQKTMQGQTETGSLMADWVTDVDEPMCGKVVVPPGFVAVKDRGAGGSRTAESSTSNRAKQQSNPRGQSSFRSVSLVSAAAASSRKKKGASSKTKRTGWGFADAVKKTYDMTESEIRTIFSAEGDAAMNQHGDTPAVASQIMDGVHGIKPQQDCGDWDSD